MQGLDIAAITRSQDFSIIKQNEDNKAAFEQQHIGQQFGKQAAAKAQEVNETQNAVWQEKKQDASEKGSNAYAGDGGRQRRGKNGRLLEEDKVVVKGRPSGFDLKI